jgi:hypothetical protein
MSRHIDLSLTRDLPKQPDDCPHKKGGKYFTIRRAALQERMPKA